MTTTSSTTSLRKRKSDASPDGATTNKQPNMRKSTSNASSASSTPSRQGSLNKVCENFVWTKVFTGCFWSLSSWKFGKGCDDKETCTKHFAYFHRDDLCTEASPTRPASRLLPAASSPPPWRVRIPASPPPVHNPCPWRLPMLRLWCTKRHWGKVQAQRVLQPQILSVHQAKGVGFTPIMFPKQSEKEHLNRK